MPIGLQMVRSRAFVDYHKFSLQENRALFAPLPVPEQLQCKFPAIGNGIGFYAGTRSPVSAPVFMLENTPKIY